MPDLPKILFVNDFPPDSMALADFVRQLLLGYPPEKIAWWYNRHSSVGGLSDLKVASTHRFPLHPKLVPNRKFRALRGFMVERFWIPQAARHLTRTIEATKPDVIWVLLWSWPILVARKAKLDQGPRLHVSLWDFPDTVGNISTLGKARSQRFLAALYDLVRNANSWDGISEAIIAEASQQTGRTGAVRVHSGFEPHHLEALQTLTEQTGDDVIRLGYVGTIISEYAFLEVLKALERIRARLPRPVMLEFFGARGYRTRSWFNPQWMIEHGVFSDKELIASLRRCSWGIVVTDPEGTDLRYSKFSFPNKIGSYLSAGMPVLGVGNSQSALAQIMQSFRVGAFTSATDIQTLEKFLTEALSSPHPRQSFRHEILRCARTEFDAQTIREKVWSTWRGMA